MLKNTCTIDIEAGTESEFYVDEFETDYKDNFESKVICNKLLLPGLCSTEQYVLVLPSPYSAKHYVPEDIASMIKFDMMHSSLLANSASTIIDQEFLTSAANEECGSK